MMILFRRTKIANTCGNPLKNLIKYLTDRTDEQIIISVDSDTDHPDKG